MYYFINFLNQNEKAIFELRYGIGIDQIEELLEELETLFVKTSEDDYKFVTPQQHDQEFNDNLSHFIDKHKGKYREIQQLNKFFKKLRIGEWFIALPRIHLKTIDYYQCRLILKAKNEDIEYSILLEEFERGLKRILSKYDIQKIGDHRLTIKPVIKNGVKTCRFCGKNEVKFSIAHSISEALGNKRIKSKDECDLCNDYFSENLEPSLINFLSIFRTAFGIKGKSGTKKIKGENVDAEYSEGRMVFTHKKGEYPIFENGQIYFQVGRIGKIRKQDIYKTLVKFFISVISPLEVTRFHDTINWIMGKRTIDRLPPIFLSIDNRRLISHPTLTIFEKLDSDSGLPNIFCEFRFAIVRIIFIIPLNVKDTEDFSSSVGFEKFQDFLSSHFEWQNLTVVNLSSSEIHDFKIDINMVDIEEEE